MKAQIISKGSQDYYFIAITMGYKFVGVVQTYVFSKGFLMSVCLLLGFLLKTLVSKLLGESNSNVFLFNLLAYLFDHFLTS